MKTPGWWSDELCYWHEDGSEAGYLTSGPDLPPASYGRGASPDLRRVEGFLRASGTLTLFQSRTPDPAVDTDLRLVHHLEYVELVEEIAAMGGGPVGAYARVGYHTAQAARLAAGACIGAVREALNGGCARHYCFVHPPGHHAMPDRGMGFCIYNNLAVAARVAQRSGAKRVAILDFDVHHGNGLQDIFYSDPDVLYISIHQDGLFPPGSGRFDETGSEAGRGTTLNIPLPPGSGEAAYLAAMMTLIRPAILHFKPDILLVSAGLDASAHDPMGRQLCTTRTFYLLTQLACETADSCCHGRIVFAHEGGYSTWYLPFLVRSVAAAIATAPLPPDPFLPALEHIPGQGLQDHQQRRIEQVLAAHRGGLL